MEFELIDMCATIASGFVLLMAAAACFVDAVSTKGVKR